VTLAFWLGTALPMAAALFGDRQLVKRLGWFHSHAETIQHILARC